MCVINQKSQQQQQQQQHHHLTATMEQYNNNSNNDKSRAIAKELGITLPKRRRRNAVNKIRTTESQRLAIAKELGITIEPYRVQRIRVRNVHRRNAIDLHGGNSDNDITDTTANATAAAAPLSSSPSSTKSKQEAPEPAAQVEKEVQSPDGKKLFARPILVSFSSFSSIPTTLRQAVARAS